MYSSEGYGKKKQGGFLRLAYYYFLMMLYFHLASRKSFSPTGSNQAS